MANPQIENGHIKIANEVADQLCRLYVTNYEQRVLWAIFRKTYGWNKKSDKISYTQFEDITGLKRQHIGRAIKLLQQRNIITVSGNKHGLVYAFQKDYHLWTTVPRHTTSHRVSLLPPEVTQEQSLPPEVTQAGGKATTITPGGNTGELLPPGVASLPPEVTKSLPPEVNTKAKSILQKQYKGFTTLLNAVKESKNKVECLAAIFVICHQDTPVDDYKEILPRMGVLLKQVRGDCGYLAKVIWDTSSAGIAGSHLNYIAATLTKKNQRLATNPNKYVAGKLGKLVVR